MRRETHLALSAIAIVLAAPALAGAAEVHYVHGPDGRLVGTFENGTALGYEYDDGGNIVRRFVCQGACFIDGACREEGTNDPDNACQRCDSAAAPVDWTGNAGQPCDDGDAETLDDACTADGECVGVAPPDPPDAGPGGGGGGGGDGGGCCRVGGPASSRGAALLALAVVAVLTRRRRRSAP